MKSAFQFQHYFGGGWVIIFPIIVYYFVLFNFIIMIFGDYTDEC